MLLAPVEEGHGQAGRHVDQDDGDADDDPQQVEGHSRTIDEAWAINTSRENTHERILIPSMIPIYQKKTRGFFDSWLFTGCAR
jgi:hypothetical protein